MRDFARRLLLVGVPLLFAVSCGGDSDGGGTPTSPTPPPPSAPPPSGVASIAGDWSGTSDFQQNGVRYISTTTATVTQTDRAVQGAVRFTSPEFQGWSANFSGTLAGTAPDTQFVGTVTVTGPSSTGTGLCVGEVTMAGPSVSNRMRWEAPSLTMTSNAPFQPASACRGTVLTLVWIFFR